MCRLNKVLMYVQCSFSNLELPLRATRREWRATLSQPVSLIIFPNWNFPPSHCAVIMPQRKSGECLRAYTVNACSILLSPFSFRFFPVCSRICLRIVFYLSRLLDFARETKNVARDKTNLSRKPWLAKITSCIKHLGVVSKISYLFFENT